MEDIKQLQKIIEAIATRYRKETGKTDGIEAAIEIVRLMYPREFSNVVLDFDPDTAQSISTKPDSAQN